jgi:hypothetical protein
VAATTTRTATAVEVVVALLARPPPHWFRRKDQRTMADLRPPVAGAHDYVPQPRVRWTAAFIGLRGHTGSLRVSRPPVWAITAAAIVPAGRPDPRMEPLAQRKLGLAVAGQLLQHHGTPSTPTSVQDWVADSDAMHHTSSSVGNISTLRPLASSNPRSLSLLVMTLLF